MSGGVSRFTEPSANSIVKIGMKATAPTDATYLNGATFDRSAIGWPSFAEVTHVFSYTAAAGAGGATIAVETNLFSGDASNMSDESSVKSKTVTITWASDAAKQFIVTVPVDLTAAKRYVRAKFRQTKAGTITVNTPLATQVVRFGGLARVPNSAYASGGYFESTDSAA